MFQCTSFNLWYVSQVLSRLSGSPIGGHAALVGLGSPGQRVRALVPAVSRGNSPQAPDSPLVPMSTTFKVSPSLFGVPAVLSVPIDPFPADVAAWPVLVVDDAPVIRKLFEFYFRKLGLPVEFAVNGQQAVDMVAARISDHGAYLQALKAYRQQQQLLVEEGLVRP